MLERKSVKIYVTSLMDGPLLWCFHSAQKLWFAHALVVVHHARVVVDVAVSEKKNFNVNLGIWICMPQTCSTNEWFVIKVMAQIIALLSGHRLILILGDINCCCCYMGYHLRKDIQTHILAEIRTRWLSIWMVERVRWSNGSSFKA